MYRTLTAKIRSSEFVIQVDVFFKNVGWISIRVISFRSRKTYSKTGAVLEFSFNDNESISTYNKT